MQHEASFTYHAPASVDEAVLQLAQRGPQDGRILAGSPSLVQCGFCIPGFLMLAVATLEKRPDLDEEEMVDIQSSNLCCCAGYANKALHDAAADMKARA